MERRFFVILHDKDGTWLATKTAFTEPERLFLIPPDKVNSFWAVLTQERGR